MNLCALNAKNKRSLYRCQTWVYADIGSSMFHVKPALISFDYQDAAGFQIQDELFLKQIELMI